MSSRRVPLWDHVKLFLILSVVIGHFVDGFHQNSHLYRSIFIFLYSFHMPLFLFVAGLFHKNTRIAQKVCSYAAIYLAYKAVLLAVFQVFSPAKEFHLLEDSRAPWYIFCLGLFILVTYLLRSVDTRFVLGVGILAACLSGYDTDIGDFLYLSRTLVFFPCYLAGTMVNREKLEGLAQNRRFKLAGWLVLLLWAAACYLGIQRIYILRHLFLGRNSFHEAILPFGAAYRLLCYLISAVVGLAVVLAAPCRDMGLVSRLGQRTLQIYFWHIPVLLVLKYRKVPALIGIEHIPGKLLWLLIAVALGLVLALPVFRFPTDYLLTASVRKE